MIKEIESTGLKYLNDFKAFIDFSKDMDKIHESFEENNPNKKRQTLIVFTDVVVDMLSNKIFNLIVTELFLR